MEGTDSHFCQAAAPKWLFFITISSARNGITHVAIWGFPISQLQEFSYITLKKTRLVHEKYPSGRGKQSKKQIPRAPRNLRHYFSWMRMIRQKCRLPLGDKDLSLESPGSQSTLSSCFRFPKAEKFKKPQHSRICAYQIKLLFAWPARTRCSSGCSWIPDVKLFSICKLQLLCLYNFGNLRPNLNPQRRYIRDLNSNLSFLKCPHIPVPFTHLDLKFNPPRFEVGWGCCAQTMPRSKNEAWTQSLRNVDGGPRLCFLPFWAGLRSSLKKCTLNKSNQWKIQNLFAKHLQSCKRDNLLTPNHIYLQPHFIIFLQPSVTGFATHPVIVKPPTTRPLRPQRWMACSGHSPLWVGVPAKKKFVMA